MVPNYFHADLPKRRKRQPMKVREQEKKEFPQHRRFVRSHECIAAKSDGSGMQEVCYGPVQFAHVRAGLPDNELAGASQKPHDAFAVPMCATHHCQQHVIGESSFEKLYGIRLLETALGLARLSPCEAIRMKAKGVQV